LSIYCIMLGDWSNTNNKNKKGKTMTMTNTNNEALTISEEDLLASAQGGGKGDYKPLEDGMYPALIAGVIKRNYAKDGVTTVIHELLFLVQHDDKEYWLTSKGLKPSLNEKSNLYTMCKQWFKATQATTIVENLKLANVLRDGIFDFRNFIGLAVTLSVSQTPAKKDEKKLYATITGYSPIQKDRRPVMPNKVIDVSVKWLNRYGDTVAWNLLPIVNVDDTTTTAPTTPTTPTTPVTGNVHTASQKVLMPGSHANQPVTHQQFVHAHTTENELPF
jgi:hypothetical protein